MNKLSDWFSNLKWGIKNTKTFFKVIWSSRPWNFDYTILPILEVHLKQLKNSIDKGYEVRSTADLKIKDIDRCLVLIKNLIEDDYLQQCGGFSISNKKMEFEKMPNKDSYKLKDDRTIEQKELDYKVLMESSHLQNSEWNELWEIIATGKYFSHGAMSWWD